MVVLCLWPQGCEFDNGSRQLFGERSSTLVNRSRTTWSIVTYFEGIIQSPFLII